MNYLTKFIEIVKKFSLVEKLWPFLKILIIVLICFLLFGKISNFLGNRFPGLLPFVTNAEYRKTLKAQEETIKMVKDNQKIIDMLTQQVTKRDSVIADLKIKKNQLEMTRLVNKKNLKNAKGNIASLDSIANGIL